ncbi:Cholinephosphotransferase 1 [Balamuthia mandrillaris]
MGRYIKQEGLEALRDYRYSGTDRSLIANYVMQPFWRRVVEYLPLSLAPNLVTLIGFAFIIAAYLLTAFFATQIKSFPAWLLLFNAVCLFVYQTMDAVDGKQARRTNTSSPLGELTDHGCDAVTTWMLALTTMSVCGIGGGWLPFALMSLATSAFFMAQWEQYHTGTLNLGYIGVTEAQLLTMGIFVATAILGPEFWFQQTTLFGLTLPHNYWLAVLNACAFLFAMSDNLRNTMKYFRAGNSKESIEKAFHRMLPLFSLIGSAVLWAKFSPTNVLMTYPHLFIGMLGSFAANIVSRMVLARVCALPYSPFQPVLILPILCSLTFSFLAPLLLSSERTAQLELAAVASCFGFSLLCYLYLAANVVSEMTAHLGISFLTVSSRAKKQS